MDIIERIMAFLTSLRSEVNRAIKDVASWDGAASNYADTPAYCDACLINVNSGDRATWTQDHCMLPVREDGDSADTYVRQAVHAAAGGHGITQVKKPSDVSQEDWDAAVKSAANKLISAYGQMDEVAPDSIYELAGKTPPATRDIGMQQLYEQIAGQVDALGWSAGSWAMVNDIYTAADGSMSVLFSMAGKLYRAPIVVSGTSAILGNLQEFEMPPMAARSISLVRQADGKARWVAVAAASVLNRVAEIDSRALFDSFIAAMPKHGYPQLRFYHDARLVMGQADWLDREDNLYLASGTVDDNELGAAFIDACEKQRGVWGCSIGFMPTQPATMVEIATGLSIPVYTAGVNTEISVLPEDSAASWFTTIGLEVTRAMDEAKKKALATLLGDEQAAERFVAKIDATNRSITEAGLITRTEMPPKEPPAEPPSPTVEDRLVALERHGHTLKEADYDALASQLAKTLGLPDFKALEERLAKLEKAIADAGVKEQARTKLVDDALAILNADLQERQRIKREDMPQRAGAATYRPRDEHAGAAPVQQVSMKDAAEKTLAAIKQ